MKTLKLTLEQARQLGMCLEQNAAQGYSIGELRQLDSILSEVEAVSGEYGRRVTGSDSLSIMETDGRQEVELELEDAEYGLLRRVWERTQFRADRGSRKVALDIHDSILGAK